MKLRVGFEMAYSCQQATPMLLMLNTHPQHAADIIVPDLLTVDPPVPFTHYYDTFGNRCSRLVTPSTGMLTLSTQAVLEVPQHPEINAEKSFQTPVEALPPECIQFLLGSRYCETDLLSDAAWKLFGHLEPGRPTVQAICDFVHQLIRFDYQLARPTRTAFDAFNEKTGVCRDFAHLGVALCRALNVPARYCTGYISDVGVPPPHSPADFCAWFEAYLGDTWQTFDPRNNSPRTGRILMARGRDASDVALSNAFGPAVLQRFKVICEPQ